MNFRTLNDFIDQLPIVLPALDRFWEFRKFKLAPMFVANLMGEPSKEDLLSDVEDCSGNLHLPYRRVRILDSTTKYDIAWLMGSREGKYICVLIMREPPPSTPVGVSASGLVADIPKDILKLDELGGAIATEDFQCFKLGKHPKLATEWARTNDDVRSLEVANIGDEETNRVMKQVEQAISVGDIKTARTLGQSHVDLLEQQAARLRKGVDSLRHGFNALLAHTGLVNFISMTNHPANHIVEVAPESNGQSVEWVKARTHYLVLHAHDGEKIVEGRADFAGSTQPLTRAAHNRRAHKVTLRSPKFKYMQGQTIWRRASWIGPKEWKGTDQKIYRVIGQGKIEA